MGMASVNRAFADALNGSGAAFQSGTMTWEREEGGRRQLQRLNFAVIANGETHMVSELVPGEADPEKAAKDMASTFLASLNGA